MSADKKEICINGSFIEVDEEVFSTYNKGDRLIRYYEKDLKYAHSFHNRESGDFKVVPSREVSLDHLAEKGVQFFAHSPGVENTVLQLLQTEQLHEALQTLTEEERQVIHEIFFEGKTEREVAAPLGISQQAIHKRKKKILQKLKIF